MIEQMSIFEKDGKWYVGDVNKKDKPLATILFEGDFAKLHNQFKSKLTRNLANSAWEMLQFKDTHD